MMWVSSRNKRTNILTVTLCVSCLFFLGTAIADAKPEVSFTDGRLTLMADNTPLLPLLESIADRTGIDIFVSTDFKPSSVSIQIIGEPCEAAIKRLLAPFSHVMIYDKQGGAIRLRAVKVYPKGKNTGRVVALAGLGPDYGIEGIAKESDLGKGSEPVLSKRSPLERSTLSRNSGLLVPNRYVDSFDGRLAKSMGKRFEIQEQNAYEKINALKAQISRTEDEKKKRALTLILMDKLEAFERLRRANRNKMEAFHRIELFHQNRLTKQDDAL